MLQKNLKQSYLKVSKLLIKLAETKSHDLKEQPSNIPRL